ncbi:serine/threonine-protein phosphatase 6 regulatory subunit 1 isoform X1 [Sesamum indicum]|uniref:Serine/threonine-protein phosphatase 6 regulatory subunit 1 isoform X1 n=2 Tax=Sesamum indicum TaxID=4182 RepID=A0A6I9TI28_SESIN|nr:serine/threonine-protein phosphatase 6 regulatory subunit 1 isoform X1 [Sesamum indicum]XP_011085213.1 serine/threonine-protein phosphatase 6 regulatory subunit 1 isoform X1 [Sesamum indicum]
MFWHMGLSTVSPVDTILDKEHFTLEELLDEDEIIQEVKALNGRLISFLQEKSQVNQLVQYIVEEAPEDAKKPRIFKFPFVACEIFTCEVDIILKALVEDDELMDLLFSFLDPGRPHSTLLAGYFSKVVVCLLLRKTAPLMNYIRAHQDIINKLVDLIGITSIMEVLIRLIGVDEHIYANYGDSMQWFEDMNVLEMIVDKFSSSDCPEVHANAAETLCTISRYAPQGLASKISSPSFIGRLFRHAFEDFRPKSVLVNLLSVCISLLDPKRLTSGVYYMYNRQMSQGAGITANPETVDGMLESLGDLLKLLDLSSEDHVLLTTYGKLQPPLGKHRLKIIEFISVLVAVSSEVAERELIRLGAVKRILELFFQYPYNNFLHHHVENVVYSCLGSKNGQFIEHLLCECNLIGKILEAEKKFTLAVDASKPTVPAEGKSPPRIGNIGHLTRMANKLIQMGNSNSEIHTFLEQNGDWADWQKNVLLKRNALENVFQWACGRPTTLLDRMRDSDDDEYQDRDYDVAALANNLSQAFQYGICTNDVIDEGHGSAERDDEDVYFDDASAEVVISSLRLGDDQESGSLFTNSDWFAFEDQRIDSSIASPSPKGNVGADGGADDVILEEDKDLAHTAISSSPGLKPTLDGNNVTSKLSEDMRETATVGLDKPPEWVEWRESFDSIELPPPVSSPETSNTAQSPSISNGWEPMESGAQPDDVAPDKAESLANVPRKIDGGSPNSNNVDSSPRPIQSAQVGDLNIRILEVDSHVGTEDSSGPTKCEDKN